MVVLTLLTGLLAGGVISAADVVIAAPNVVAISPQLVTSGQPSAEALAGLAAQGFGAVIYLAPLTVPDAIAGEAEIVRKQGLEFINIPIRFGNPTEADFQSFVAAMRRLGDRKVLVHCQVNMRASSMTFLYRAIVLHEKPELAYESVARVWSPEGPWKSLLVSQLRKAGIQFEPY
ncbi:protein tyrosine phosphatase family protein [Duganella sp. S19_KUP01_CR8]|uniref:protein tyrosine phosphatase family protein n=1 Tax=Duganella sp. S19_KUP01_CR8 TaxID=3025502 RepID=UPI002FCDDB49